MPPTQSAIPCDGNCTTFEDAGKHHLDRLRAEYGSTANPLYVWEALGGLLNFQHDKALADALPDWIRDYLARAAMLISLLTSGIDHVAVEKLMGEGVNSFDAVMNSMGKISPTEATKRVGEILGFEKRGQNVFLQYKTRSEILDDFIDYGEMLSDGVAAREAMTEIMERRRIYDERTIRRRMATARAMFPSEGEANQQRESNAKQG
jgi:hypothetical protein